LPTNIALHRTAGAAGEVSSENVAHRIAVRWITDAGEPMKGCSSHDVIPVR
jgi:hypothetical protein